MGAGERPLSFRDFRSFRVFREKCRCLPWFGDSGSAADDPIAPALLGPVQLLVDTLDEGGGVVTFL